MKILKTDSGMVLKMPSGEGLMAKYSEFLLKNKIKNNKNNKSNKNNK